MLQARCGTRAETSCGYGVATGYVFHAFNAPHHDSFLAERNRERSILDTYASRTAPELIEFERRLQCYVEGIEKDKILVRFTHVDKSDFDREFSVVIDVSSNTYKSKHTGLVFARFY